MANSRLVIIPVLNSLIEKIGRYGFLLISMLLMIGLKPFLNDLIEAVLLADIFIFTILLSGAYALSKTPKAFRFSCFIVFIILFLRAIHYSIGDIQELHILELMLTMIFIMQILLMIIGHLMREQEITADIVMGGACAFVLFGFVWGFAYYLLDILQPHSFTRTNPLNNEVSDYIYFSFVTVTSLGYGDILPVTQQARGLSVLEAIIGQLYLAIMISRLVSLHISNSQGK